MFGPHHRIATHLRQIPIFKPAFPFPLNPVSRTLPPQPFMTKALPALVCFQQPHLQPTVMPAAHALDCKDKAPGQLGKTAKIDFQSAKDMACRNTGLTGLIPPSLRPSPPRSTHSFIATLTCLYKLPRKQVASWVDQFQHRKAQSQMPMPRGYVSRDPHQTPFFPSPRRENVVCLVTVRRLVCACASGSGMPHPTPRSKYRAMSQQDTILYPLFVSFSRHDLSELVNNAVLELTFFPSRCFFVSCCQSGLQACSGGVASCSFSLLVSPSCHVSFVGVSLIF